MMAMQMKKLSAMIAAATLGTAMSMSAMADDSDAGTVTFSKTIDPICTMTTDGDDLSRDFETQETTDQGDGHFDRLADNQDVVFDCNSDAVDLEVTLTLEGDGESQHKAEVSTTVAGSPGAFVTNWVNQGSDYGDAVTKADSEQTLVSPTTAYASGGVTGSAAAAGGQDVITDQDGDITVNVSSEFTPGSGSDELMENDYEAEFVVTVTAS